MTETKRHKMAKEMEAHLKQNILPYWINKMTDPAGGYYGRRDADDTLHADAPRGAIMNARILWTMSAAYRLTGDQNYLQAASHAYDYIVRRFIDPEFGGVFQAVDSKGIPLDTKKQFYALAFMIYGLSEYHRASGDQSALNEAIALFRLIEKHSRDREKGGYFEAMTRDWKPVDDMRLSEKDANSCKTMNTHLHILEAYSALYRVWPDETLREALTSLIVLTLNKIVDSKSGHLGLFFDRDWNREDGDISYGHDIEASWLLLEAAQTLGDTAFFDVVKTATGKIADAALEGRCFDGSMIYERHRSGSYDNEKHWWVQAENVVGQLYLWKFHGLEGFDDKALQTWEYIKEKIVDNQNGEWYWSRLSDGSVNLKEDKAGYWKCPYHNGRMVMESIRILQN
ncbi:MAG: AGE family epimerase/isomerase [Paramuribaculum sp.]|nr:AGE family epimerase/isomerase [Paramuribaculum sp.]